MPHSPRSLSIKLATLPKKPGVYQFKDAKGNILYIGKAKNLRSRVTSYFRKNPTLEERKIPMLDKIAQLETIVTSTEAEALLLEATLVKKEQPPFNIFLKDGKRFAFIRVTTSEDYPTVALVRTVENRRDAYFGPYVSGANVRETLRVLKRVFRYRTCAPLSGRACFDYGIGRCLGVCVDAIPKKEYRAMITQLMSFLKGKGDMILKQLHAEMMMASASKQFEYAARLRDRIRALENVLRRQDVISSRRENEDVLGIACEKRLAIVSVLEVRDGKLMQKQTIALAKHPEETESQVMHAFIQQYYAQSAHRPKLVLAEILPKEQQLLQHALNLAIIRPARGHRKKLALIAHENSIAALNTHLASFEKDDSSRHEALVIVQNAFKLPRPPRRIESFDVANISGQHAVGSMAVFTDGKPDKKCYKRFSIKTVKGTNDPLMIAEIVHRRFVHLESSDATWRKPDLIVLDGGKGQLSVVAKQLGKAATAVPIVALAKGGHQKPTEQSGRERFYVLNGKEVRLEPTSSGLFLLERLRDEAHRFATAYYKKRHIRASLASVLDEISGIGKKRKEILLRHFGSFHAVRAASEKEIADIIGPHAAKLLKNQKLR